MPDVILQLFLLACISHAGAAAVTLPDIVRIGGLFNPEDELQEIAFRYAVDRINMDRVLLPKTTLVPIIERVASLDSFHTAKRVCNMTMEGVAAIFGPQSRSTAGMVQAVCDNKEIPHIETRWESQPPPGNSYHINLYPDPQVLGIAYQTLLRDMGWTSFTIIYQHNDALIRLQEVIKYHGPSDPPITIRQLDEGTDHRPLLKQIQASGESHVILDCDTDKVPEILRQAREVKMLEEYQGYVITSIDIHTIELDEFKTSGANITAFRIVDPSSQEVVNAVHDWTYGEKRYGRLLRLTAHQVKTEVALIHDAVHLFAKALHDLASSQRINIRPLSCKGLEKWEHGINLINYMRVLRMETRGLTGALRFDPKTGLRTDFSLDMVELKRHGLIRTGTWDPNEGIKHTVSYNETLIQYLETLHNKTMTVTSRIGPPYLMHVKDWERLEGNARFEGYSMDLITEVSKIIGFKFKFELVPDGRYGSYNPVTKKWDGLIKQILDRKAELAICDLTITYDRERAVDFTMPFMNLGISILYSKPVKQPPNLFSFLSPLSVDVWIYMATAYLGVSLILFILARLSPTEWQNPHPCNQEPEELESQFNLLNSMWFAIGSLMQQGCDFLPKAVSTRMVAGMWWFFTLIMISSYTANLAAFLTVERMDATIESAEDLAKQTKIKYGVVSGGSTASFFKNSNFSTYQRMWSFMEATRPSVFSSSNGDGVERVLKSKRSYAFIMESTSIEYVIERNCDLMQVGGLLDSKGYGIAMPLNSPYRTAISGAVLQLQENGMLNTLKNKWWREQHDGGKCSKVDKTSGAAGPELGLANVGGVFVVLMAGLGMACIVGCLEFLWKTRKAAVEERATFCTTMREEIRFALNCNSVTKPVRKSGKTSQSPTESLRRSYDKLQLDSQ